MDSKMGSNRGGIRFRGYFSLYYYAPVCPWA